MCEFIGLLWNLIGFYPFSLRKLWEVIFLISGSFGSPQVPVSVCASWCYSVIVSGTPRTSIMYLIPSYFIEILMIILRNFYLQTKPALCTVQETLRFLSPRLHSENLRTMEVFWEMYHGNLCQVCRVTKVWQLSTQNIT